MRILRLWPLLLAISFIGCALSPGHDLPSAGTEGGNEGPAPPVPGGDGDLLIPGGDGDADPIMDPPCTAGGGAGGMGGACGETAAEP